MAKSRGDEVDDGRGRTDEAEAATDEVDERPTATDADDDRCRDDRHRGRRRGRTEPRSTRPRTTTSAPTDGDGPTVDELVADNTKDELLALAEQAGIDVAKSANKGAIAEAIVAGSAGTDEGDA